MKEVNKRLIDKDALLERFSIAYGTLNVDISNETIQIMRLVLKLMISVIEDFPEDK